MPPLKSRILNWDISLYSAGQDSRSIRARGTAGCFVSGYVFESCSGPKRWGRLGQARIRPDTFCCRLRKVCRNGWHYVYVYADWIRNKSCVAKWRQGDELSPINQNRKASGTQGCLPIMLGAIYKSTLPKDLPRTGRGSLIQFRKVTSVP